MQRLALAILVLFCAPFTFGQSARCTDTCTPSGGSTTYQTNTPARADLNNARGVSNPAAPQRLTAGDVKKDPDLAGSQSYSFSAPILHLPGRNGLDLDLTLAYNSHVWTINKSNSTATFNADRDYPGYGFRLGFGYLEKIQAGLSQTFIVTESDGTKHKLVGSQSSTYSSASDGSALLYIIASQKLYYKNGLTITFQQFPGSTTLFRPITITDTNGNYISIVYGTSTNMSELQIATITDTLGRVITFAYTPDNPQSPTYWLLSSITQALSGGGTKTWASFQWRTDYVLRYTFSGLTTNSDSPASGDTTHPQHVLTKCIYPNGTAIVFNYGSNGDWGVVTGIDRTTNDGATVRSSTRYNYPAYTVAQTDHPTYSSKTVSDAQGHSMAWSFATVMSGNKVSRSTVTNPDSTSTVTTLYTDGSASDGYTQSVQLKSPTGTALKTASYTYAGGLPNAITTTLNDSGQQSKQVLTFDSYGNLAERDDYDFGLVLKRKTLFSYITTPAYLANACHLLSLQSQVLVEDASSNILAKSTFAYDGTTPTNANAPQHNSTTCNSSNNIRGNLTSVTRWSDIANNISITRSSTYDTLGNLLTAQPECCNQQTITYSTTFNNAYPTQVVVGSSGATRTTTSSYDFDTGKIVSIQDVANNLATSFQYDSMNRVSLASFPNSTTITSSYNDDSTNPWVIQTNSSANTAISATHYDALDRPDEQEVRDKSGNVFSRVDTIYDNMSRISQVSNPHLTTDSAVFTTYSYDALGRTTAVTPSGGSGSYITGYSGNAVRLTDPAGKERINRFDSLDRLIEVDEPGWGDGLPSHATTTLTGGEQNYGHWTVCNAKCIQLGGEPVYIIDGYDAGTVTLTVNGSSSKTVSYGQNSTATSVATALASAINSDATQFVIASASGANITVTSKVANTTANYALSASSTYDTVHFTHTSFALSLPNPPSMSGSRDPSGADTATLVSPMITTYSYDVLNDLQTVSQAAMGPVGGQQLAGQSRTYTYDALGRLKSRALPESGVTQYTYLNSGNVDTRTDARMITTKYCYDGLNRLQAVSYTNNCSAPNISYVYGSTAGAYGQVASVTDGSGSSTFTYSLLGFLIQEDKVINGTHYILRYNYDEAGTGKLNYIAYPSNRKITQKYDTIGRLWNLTDTPSAGTEVSRITVNSFNAAAQPLTILYGNSVAETLDYDSNQGLIGRMRYDDPSGNHLLDLNYNYAGSIGNNRQIVGIADALDTTKTTSYTYDAWSRLKAASAGGGATWSISWDYDRFGNRLNQNGGGFATQNTINPATNRISTSGYIYDQAGNLTSDGFQDYSYDSDNRMASVAPHPTGNPCAGCTTLYTYDSSNRRVTSHQNNIEAATYVYVYHGPRLLAEYANGVLMKEYEYFGSRLVATIDSTNNVTYQHPDHLSTRVETDSAGNVVRTYGHYPFGEDWYESGTAGSEFKFTSYQGSNPRYAINRNMSERIGRFLSPDPLAGDITNPQSFSRYTYALNDPIRLIDPLGLKCIVNSSDGNTVDDGTPPPCNALTGGEVAYDFNYSFDWGPEQSGPVHHIPVLKDHRVYLEAQGDVRQFFVNFARLKWEERHAAAMTPPTSEQYIQEIAKAAPTVCGGGAFVYGGPSAEHTAGGTGVEGAGVGLYEWDSRTGFSSNVLIEGSAGPVGGGVIINTRTGEKTPILLSSSPVGGTLYTRSSIGAYVGTSNLGAGGYVNVMTNAACNANPKAAPAPATTSDHP